VLASVGSRIWMVARVDVVVMGVDERSSKSDVARRAHESRSPEWAPDTPKCDGAIAIRLAKSLSQSLALPTRSATTQAL
jgi:hypothetical protein